MQLVGYPRSEEAGLHDHGFRVRHRLKSLKYLSNELKIYQYLQTRPNTNQILFVNIPTNEFHLQQSLQLRLVDLNTLY